VPTRALVRCPEHADALRGYDCETAIGDYTDLHSLDHAPHGVDRVFLVSPFGPCTPQLEAALIEALGRPVSYQSLPAEQYEAALRSAGCRSGTPARWWSCRPSSATTSSRQGPTRSRRPSAGPHRGGFLRRPPGRLRLAGLSPISRS